MEKWESFKAKMVERKKTLQERRGVMVRLETFMAQRETEVSSVDLSFKILISRSSALHDTGKLHRLDQCFLLLTSLKAFK